MADVPDPFFDAVIFDCDGTLVDSETIGTRVLAECLAEHGYPLTPAEALARFRGVQLATSLAGIAAELGQPLPAAFVPDFRRRSALAFQASLAAMPGAGRLVSSIAVPVAVASSGPPEKIELCLRLTELWPLFAGRVFSSFEIGSWKPEPGLFLHAARALGVAPGRCAVVEDSLPGVVAGLAAGMTVFAFQPHDPDPRLPAGVTVVRELCQLHDLLPQRHRAPAAGGVAG